VGFGLTLFLVPMALGGLTIPTWAALAAIVGYAVVPLSVFQATPFMWLAGIELVRRDGTRPDPIDVLFREILGRGLGPAAYLVTFLFALIGWATGRLGVSSPLGGAGLSLAVLACLGALMIAAAGQALALVSPERRTLADLIARTIVIPRAAAAVEQGADPEEEAERRAQRRARLRNVVLFEAALVLIMVGGPVVAVRAPAAQRASYAAHLNLEADQRRFESNPTDAEAAQVLAMDYRRTGDEERAAKVEARQVAALSEVNTKREAGLRTALQANPKDDDASDALIDLLEDQGRAGEARAVREAAFRADPNPEAQASYGVWLYERDANAAAVTQLSAALDAGFEAADAHAYLGLALKELGRKAEARAELKRALELDPDLDDVADEVQQLDEELGPAPAQPKKTARGGKR
jgi:Tfp pilus assembly protein PilF/uncharacterized RDD family membrane protein YckC